MASGSGLLVEHKGIRKSLDHLIIKDRYFRDHFTVEDLAEIKHTQRPVSYEAFVRTIVGQQVSTAAANTIWTRVSKLVTPFTPENVQKLPDQILRDAGLSAQKVAYVRSLSDALIAKTFNFEDLHAMTDDEVIASITALKGFGRWSAEMVLMFALGRTDVFSGGDLGLREGVRRVLKLEDRPTEKQAIEMAQRWAGHRTAASLLLWVICHRDAPRPKVKTPKIRNRVAPPPRSAKGRSRIVTMAKRAAKRGKRK